MREKVLILRVSLRTRALVAPWRAAERHFLLPMAPVTNNQHSKGRRDPRGLRATTSLQPMMKDGRIHISLSSSLPFFVCYFHTRMGPNKRKIFCQEMQCLWTPVQYSLFLLRWEISSPFKRTCFRPSGLFLTGLLNTILMWHNLHACSSRPVILEWLRHDGAAECGHVMGSLTLLLPAPGLLAGPRGGEETTWHPSATTALLAE